MGVMHELLGGTTRGAVAGGMGAPVDAATLALNALLAGGGYAGHKMGLLQSPPGLIENPVGGSEWIAGKMRGMGLLNDTPGTTADNWGIALGGLLGPLTAAKAPQIARGLLHGADNLAAPERLSKQAGAIRMGGMNAARKNIDSVLAGHQPSPQNIATLTDDQFAQVNAARKASGFAPLPDKEVFYIGPHHVKSRGEQGYATQDMLKQLMSGLDDTAKVDIDRLGRVGLVSTRPRADGYGNMVEDRVVLQPSKGATISEVFSVIPKGDKANTPLDQLKIMKAGKNLPGERSDVTRFQRLDSDQPMSSLVTDHDVRNWIAQDNAVPALGLHRNNTPMERARALGFDADTYHGTNSDVDAFTKVNGGNMWGRATYLTDSAEDASKYATGWHNRITPDGNAAPNVMPLLSHGRFVEMDAPMRPADIRSLSKLAELPLKDYMFSNKGRDVVQTLNEQTMEGANHWLQKAKFDGMQGAGKNTPAGGAGSVQAVFNPANIRSRFAAFDPMRRNEADLLGRADPELLKLMSLGLLGYGGYNAMGAKE